MIPRADLIIRSRFLNFWNPAVPLVGDAFDLILGELAARKLKGKKGASGSSSLISSSSTSGNGDLLSLSWADLPFVGSWLSPSGSRPPLASAAATTSARDRGSSAEAASASESSSSTSAGAASKSPAAASAVNSNAASIQMHKQTGNMQMAIAASSRPRAPRKLSPFSSHTSKAAAAAPSSAAGPHAAGSSSSIKAQRAAAAKRGQFAFRPVFGRT